MLDMLDLLSESLAILFRYHTYLKNLNEAAKEW